MKHQATETIDLTGESDSDGSPSLATSAVIPSKRSAALQLPLLDHSKKLKTKSRAFDSTSSQLPPSAASLPPPTARQQLHYQGGQLFRSFPSQSANNPWNGLFSPQSEQQSILLVSLGFDFAALEPLLHSTKVPCVVFRDSNESVPHNATKVEGNLRFDCWKHESRNVWEFLLKGRDARSQMKGDGVAEWARVWKQAEGRNSSFHAKVIVIDFGTFVRVVISSRNFTTASSSNEEIVHVHDFPLLATPSTSAGSNPTHTSYSQALRRFFLEDLQHAKFDDLYCQLDFSSSDGLGLVSSSQGLWEGEEGVTRGGGIVSLANTMTSMRQLQGPGVDTIVMASWLNKQSDRFAFLHRATLHNFYAACRGAPTSTFVNDEPKSSFKDPEESSLNLPTTQQFSMVWNPPVKQGWQSNGYEVVVKEAMKKYVRPLVNKVKPPKLLEHSKIVVIINVEKKTGKAEGFVYAGSANLTHFAWGDYKTTTQGSIQASFGVDKPKPKLNICNTELGVVVRLKGTTRKALEAEVDEIVSFKRPWIEELAL